ncbi:pseudouridine-5'-phosphate glycosidase [Coralliovum pocilloporae]|uniref:pseudouridine-5'-phosphate glycosidase n=1 Tax=Coralliovum pocilloporae TaxID=3066369 RepID=UPI00330798A0
MSETPFRIIESQAVQQAKAQKQPIVALESTIITHGMPYPQNLETAREVEQTVRDNGAIPATIAVLDGHLHIGLEDDELERLAQARKAMKLSRADLAYAVALKKTGSTTVAATMMAAHQAGIEVFATGGIGGVHRGAEESFDISADLDEFTKTPVIVVSAGAKALLDLPKTLEVLETRGIPVISYGTDSFPAFWSASSPLPAPLRCDSPEEISAFHETRRILNAGEGMLVANPIPADHEIPREEMENHIAVALGNAEDAGISGKGVTPYLLQRIYELTEGRSLVANIALVKNNAKLAAEIAARLTRVHNT